MTSDPHIHEVGAVVVHDGRILVVRKHGPADAFIVPGGKPEGNETHAQTLRRELREQLDVAVRSSQYMGPTRIGVM